MAPFRLQSQQWLFESFSHFITLTLTLLIFFSTFKDLCEYTGPPQITQDTLPNLFIYLGEGKRKDSFIEEAGNPGDSF